MYEVTDGKYRITGPDVPVPNLDLRLGDEPPVRRSKAMFNVIDLAVSKGSLKLLLAKSGKYTVDPDRETIEGEGFTATPVIKRKSVKDRDGDWTLTDEVAPGAWYCVEMDGEVNQKSGVKGTLISIIDAAYLGQNLHMIDAVVSTVVEHNREAVQAEEARKAHQAELRTLLAAPLIALGYEGTTLNTMVEAALAAELTKGSK